MAQLLVVEDDETIGGLFPTAGYRRVTATKSRWSGCR